MDLRDTLKKLLTHNVSESFFVEAAPDLQLFTNFGIVFQEVQSSKVEPNVPVKVVYRFSNFKEEVLVEFKGFNNHYNELIYHNWVFLQENKMSVKEELEKLVATEGVAQDFFYWNYDQDLFNSAGFEFKLVEDHGGEGQGEDYWRVYSFKKGEETHLIKFYGWYASYVGSEYEGWKFVKPVQRMVTFYD